MLEQWIIAMAVLLTVIHPELTESSSNCYFDKGTNIQTISVGKNATAFVSCPALTKNETLKNIIIHKGDTELAFTAQELRRLQQWVYSPQQNSYSYILDKISRSKANDTELYRCTVGTGSKTYTSRTILLIKEPLQPIEPPPTCPVKQTMPLTVSCGIIIAYNLCITVVSGFLTYKLKNKDQPENPYMNTRPQGFRRHRLAQHPANQHSSTSQTQRL